MGRSIVFVTTELDPITPGGAGAVVARLGQGLHQAGHDVTVVLISDASIDGGLYPFRIVAAPPGNVAEQDPSLAFLDRSRVAAEALAHLVASSPPDLVEFQDFEGLAHEALAYRSTLGLTGVPLTVRMHGPIDLIAETMVKGHAEWDVVRLMEAGVYRMADAVVVPSRAMAEVAAARYGLDEERLVVGEPPIPEAPRFERRATEPPMFLVYGRLGEVKGSIEAVRAAVEVLDGGRPIQMHFAGEDGWHAAAGRSMQAHLQTLLGDDHKGSVVFHGRLSREDVARRAAGARAVIIPSRFESFCLAAHEARAMGAALIVADLPAFREHFDESTGALRYDGTTSALAATMTRLVDDPGLADRLAASPLPTYADPLAGYAGALPRPRHERSQAGLATASVKEIQAALGATRRLSTVAKTARAVLRVLPAPVARAAIRVVPGPLKDRFRGVASWPEEVERRQAARTARDFAARATPEAFPPIPPVVSVVIPCYNQGEFLNDAIRSVFAQSFAAWEIIVVDDGSDDAETVRIIDAVDLPRTRTIHQENRGLPAARNRGMAEARGRFLVPLDADDELAPGYMTELVAALEANPLAGYAHCWAELFGDQSGIFATRPFNPYQQLLSNGVIGAALIRKEAWQDAGGYDETMRRGNEDWDLWLRIDQRGWAQVQVRRALFRYRKHGTSMSTETEARFEQARIEMADRHPSFYQRDALARLKSHWYPAISIIVGDLADLGLLGAQETDDVEVLSTGTRTASVSADCERRGWLLRAVDGDLADAVAASRGKFVIDWDTVAVGGPTLVADLASALEARPDAAAAGVAADEPLMWRRWALVAETQHTGTIEVDTKGAARDDMRTLGRACCPQEGWSITDGVLQSPEEDAFLPSWLPEEAS